MRRQHFLIISGLVSLILCIAVYATRPAARADLPQSTATQIYEPDFEEWALLYLNACYRDYSNQSHFVGVGKQTVNGRLRFKIVGSYNKSPLGQAWFDKIGSKIRQSIETDCKRWTAEGFPISLNDFEIDITQANDKAQ